MNDKMVATIKAKNAIPKHWPAKYKEGISI
jgi:hypothetical protein